MSTPAGGNRPELRISDTEREAAVTALGEHYAAGRLTKDEYDERTSTAYAARTASALRPLFGDLPSPHPFAGGQSTREPAGAGSRPPGPGGWSRPDGRGPRPLGGGPGQRPGFRMPFLPLVLVLVGVTILLGAPWLLFIGLGAFFFARAHRRSHRSGAAYDWSGSTWSGCGSSRTRHG